MKRSRRFLASVVLAGGLAAVGCGSDGTTYYFGGASETCGAGTAGYFRQVATPGGDGTAISWVGSCLPPGAAPPSDRPGVAFP